VEPDTLGVPVTDAHKDADSELDSADDTLSSAERLGDARVLALGDAPALRERDSDSVPHELTLGLAVVDAED